MSDARAIIAAVSAAVGEEGPTLLEGELAVELGHLHRLYRIVWFIDDGAEPVLRLVAPKGGALPELDWASIDAETMDDEGGLLVAWDETGGQWETLRRLEDAGTLLARGGLENETAIALMTASIGDDDEPDDPARQLYGGTVRDGRWHIGHVFPKIGRPDLERALALSAAVDEADELELASVEEAERVVARAESELAFGGDQLTFEREGSVVRPRWDGEPTRMAMGLVATSAFRAVFEDGPWDLSGLEEEDEAMDAAMQQLQQGIQTLATAFQQKAPGAGREVHRGERGRYLAGSLVALPHVTADDVVASDAEMAAQGLAPIGDLICEAAGNAVVRGYVGDAVAGYGVIMATTEGLYATELYTALDDRTSVTTSTNPGAADIDPSAGKRGCFLVARPELELEELLEAHRKAVKGKTGKPAAAPPTLEGLATAIDEFLTRFTSGGVV